MGVPDRRRAPRSDELVGGLDISFGGTGVSDVVEVKDREAFDRIDNHLRFYGSAWRASALVIEVIAFPVFGFWLSRMSQPVGEASGVSAASA